MLDADFLWYSNDNRLSKDVQQARAEDGQGIYMNRTFYEKRGRRYFPVREYDSDVMDAMPRGSHLVVVQPGQLSVRYDVSPDHAKVLAALKPHHEAMLTVLRDASKMRPDSRKLTAKEQEAIKAYYAIMGPDALFTMTIPCASDIIHALEVGLLTAIEADK